MSNAFKENIKIVDATLRDGGLVNNFYFEDSFVKALYDSNIKSGVDYMEFGYRADKKQFSPDKFGKWKFTSDEDIYAIIGENKTNMKISVMVDVGRTDYINDIKPKAQSPVDLFRVATYIDTIDEAIEMINHIHYLGYETTCNIMAITKDTDEQITNALNKLAHSPVIGVYIVDSYGALYPKQTRKLTRLYAKYLSQYGKMIGIHAHNNQQCAFANTIEAYNLGAEMLDATAYGMGRGAGNCFMEALLGYFNGAKYHIEPILDFVSKYMLPLKNQGIEWGYNTSYLLTGLTNVHPKFAIAATKNKDDDYVGQLKALNYEE